MQLWREELKQSREIQEGIFLFLMGVIIDGNDNWNHNNECSERKKVKNEVMGLFVSLKILNPNVSFPTNLYQ